MNETNTVPTTPTAPVPTPAIPLLPGHVKDAATNEQYIKLESTDAEGKVVNANTVAWLREFSDERAGLRFYRIGFIPGEKTQDDPDGELSATQAAISKYGAAFVNNAVDGKLEQLTRNKVNTGVIGKFEQPEELAKQIAMLKKNNENGIIFSVENALAFEPGVREKGAAGYMLDAKKLHAEAMSLPIDSLERKEKLEQAYAAHAKAAEIMFANSGLM
jgi:hypothetical protein